MQSPLIKTALSLSGSRLNPLVLMSDPDRTPDLLELVRRMPADSALIYRHFGEPDLETGLRSLTNDRGIQLLIGNDPDLAAECGADGVHFSRRTDAATVATWRERQPDWIISAAAPKPWAIPYAAADLDAVFVSSIFASRSPTSGTPIGVSALRRITKDSPCPVFALGGINDQTAPSLVKTGIAGIAAIDGFRHALDLTGERSHTGKARPTMKAPDTNTDPIEAKPNPSVSISKHEEGDQIIFTAEVAGESETGELTLKRVADNLWNANHTGVPSEIGGRGIGKALIQAMVEDARQSGYKVVPGCPFVAKLFERRPEWAEGVAA